VIGTPRLRRVLALRDLVVVAGASMGPAFSLATTLAAMVAAAGRGTELALALVALLMAMTAVGYRRLGARMPNAGSSYTWIRAALGPTTGAYGAWVLLVANIFAVQATALPAGTYTLDLLAPGLASSAPAVALVGCAWTAGSALLLWYGLRPTALLAGLLLVAELVVLAVAAACSALHRHADAVAFSGAPISWDGVLAAMVVGIWMLDGWEVSASTAEEAEGGPATSGSGGLGGLLLTALVMLAATWAFLRTGSPAGYDTHQADALAYVGGLLGPAWRPILAVTVLISLAASLQTTLVYLSRTVYAMGRDDLVPRSLGRLDRRDEPAAAIILITVIALVCCLAAGLSPGASQAFALALGGTSWFLGVLFAMSALAAVRTFLGDPQARWSGVILPGLAAVGLAAILAVAFVRDDPMTRGFIAAAAILGLPLALWRGRALRRAGGTEGVGHSTGSRF
jgi:amino acid transporter